MWAEMSDKQREEYKDYFIAYHNGVAKTGITGKRIKPLTVLPKNVISGFQKALLTQVRTVITVVQETTISLWSFAVLESQDHWIPEM